MNDDQFLNETAGDGDERLVDDWLAQAAGMALPSLGFGTYRLTGNDCFAATRTALELGYRHIDTAMAYENESAIGAAIEDSSVDREEVFLTTKIKGYPRYLEHDSLIAAAEDCLARLGTDYIDLLLIHWWNSRADMRETFEAMAELRDAGKINQIGVSNFSVEQLDRAVAVSDAPIVTNQVEYHPYQDRSDLLEYCRENDILITAYSPLAEGRVIEDDRITDIGDRYGKSAAQISIRWLIQQPGVIAIPKASDPAHMKANLDVFDFALTEREMQHISELGGPLWYRLNAEGGAIYRFRSGIGPYVPKTIRDAVP